MKLITYLKSGKLLPRHKQCVAASLSSSLLPTIKESLVKLGNRSHHVQLLLLDVYLLITMFALCIVVVLIV